VGVYGGDCRRRELDADCLASVNAAGASSNDGVHGAFALEDVTEESPKSASDHANLVTDLDGLG
jgi:hypothetical protein